MLSGGYAFIAGKCGGLSAGKRASPPRRQPRPRLRQLLLGDEHRALGPGAAVGPAPLALVAGANPRPADAHRGDRGAADGTGSLDGAQSFRRAGVAAGSGWRVVAPAKRPKRLTLQGCRRRPRGAVSRPAPSSEPRAESRGALTIGAGGGRWRRRRRRRSPMSAPCRVADRRRRRWCRGGALGDVHRLFTWHGRAASPPRARGLSAGRPREPGPPEGAFAYRLQEGGRSRRRLTARPRPGAPP